MSQWQQYGRGRTTATTKLSMTDKVTECSIKQPNISDSCQKQTGVKLLLCQMMEHISCERLLPRCCEDATSSSSLTTRQKQSSHFIVLLLIILVKHYYDPMYLINIKYLQSLSSLPQLQITLHSSGNNNVVTLKKQLFRLP